MLLRRALPGIIGSTLAVILAASVLNAQINRGVIEGIVSDAQGAIVAGAQVEITSIDTNITARTTSNDSGYYRVGDLVPGKYRAEVKSAGFSTMDLRNIDVS